MGDFFGHESILTIWNKGTSSKNLLLFPEIMLWNEDVPLNLWSMCRSDSLHTHGTSHWWISQEGGNRTLAKQPSFPSETRCLLTGINVTKPMRLISTRCIIYIFLVTTITCLTSEQQPWLDGGIFSNVPCQHKVTCGGHFVQ